jgi:hypothetical protein
MKMDVCEFKRNFKTWQQMCNYWSKMRLNEIYYHFVIFNDFYSCKVIKNTRITEFYIFAIKMFNFTDFVNFYRKM